MATTTFKNFRITSTYTGSKPAGWSINGRDNWNHHKITVTNKETGARTSFDFWASIMSPEIRTRRDLLNALECFLSDAIAFDNAVDEDDFCQEFGYTKISDCLRAWKGCEKAYDKAMRIMSGTEIYDISNEIRDI